MKFELNGKTALITASCRGIGRACAEALAGNEISRIAICCRSKSHIDLASKEIGNTHGIKVDGFECDISKIQDLDALVSNFYKKTNRIDILIVNSGTPNPGSFSNCNMSDWEEGINLCLRNTIYLCKKIIPGMKQMGFGRIIFLTSVFAKEPDVNFVISSTLRSSLLALNKCLSVELATSGITVNAICQGYVDTSLLREVAIKNQAIFNKSAEIILKEWSDSIPLRRFARPLEIGNLIAFLSSEHGSYITGTALSIDGGILRGV